MSLAPLLCFALLSWGMEQSAMAQNQLAIPACAQTRCQGERAKHWMGQFQFCIPRGMKYRRAAGFEGDLHDRVTISVQGERSEMVLFTANPTWGPVKPSPTDWPRIDPAQPERIRTQHWRCAEGTGRDFRFQREGRHWRMISFPDGFAEYKNVPLKAAQAFDRVLDSLCCQKITIP